MSCTKVPIDRRLIDCFGVNGVAHSKAVELGSA